MKIIYLHQYFNTSDMPGGTRSYEMAKRFVEQGHEVHMITSWRAPCDDKTWIENEVDGIHVYWLPVEYSNQMSFPNRIKSFFRFAFKSAIKAASISADVLFATSTPLTIALPAVYASKKQKIPMLFEIRDLWPVLPIAMGALKNPVTRFLAKQLELFAYRNSSSIVSLSPGIKEGVLRTGYPSSRIAVIPNSSDLDMFRVDPDLGYKFRVQRDWLNNKPLLVYTGTFGLINGVGYMIDLAVSLSNLKSDVRILLIGDGMELKTIMERAEASGVLNQNLFVENSLPKNEIPSVLDAATMASSLFIDIPEMRSNSANKFFDALASGTPVFINYGGWMHELIKDRGCGLAMWQKPIDQVARDLDEKMHDVLWLTKASQAAVILAENSFDRDVLARQLLDLLIATVQGIPERAESIAPGKYF